MAFHRFVATFEVTVAAPGAGTEPASPADPKLASDLAAAIDSAVTKKIKVKKGTTEYTVETVKKV